MMTMEEMLMRLMETTDQLSKGQKQIIERLDRVENEVKEAKSDIVEMKNDIVEVKNDIVEMKNDIEEIKEDTHITRTALNGLIGRTEDFVHLHDPTYKF